MLRGGCTQSDILKGGCQIEEHLLRSIVVCGKLAVLISGVKLGVHGMCALCNLKRKFSNTSIKIRPLVPVQLRTTLVAISPLCSGLSMTAAILSTVSVYRLCSQMTSHGGMSSFIGSCSSASMFLDFQTSFCSLIKQRLQEKDCSTVTTAMCGPCRTRGQ